MNNEIKIRMAKVEDAKELLDIYEPYVRNTAITFEYVSPSLQTFTERICNVLDKYPYLLAEKNGEVLGYAYADSFHERAAYNWAVETTVYIKMDKRKLGIGKILYNELENILKSQGILNLNACIACLNAEDEHISDDSLVFHKKCGYKYVGKFHKCGYKFNRWYDMVWMEKHIGPHISDPHEIKNISEINIDLK